MYGLENFFLQVVDDAINGTGRLVCMKGQYKLIQKAYLIAVSVDISVEFMSNVGQVSLSMWPIVSSSKQKRYSEVPFQVLKAHQDNQVHEVIAVKQDHQVYPVVVAVQECLAKTDLLEGEVLEGNQERVPMLMLPRLKTFWKY